MWVLTGCEAASRNKVGSCLCAKVCLYSSEWEELEYDLKIYKYLETMQKYTRLFN